MTSSMTHSSSPAPDRPTPPVSRRKFIAVSSATLAAGNLMATTVRAAESAAGSKLALFGGDKAITTPPSRRIRWGMGIKSMLMNYAEASGTATAAEVSAGSAKTVYTINDRKHFARDHAHHQRHRSGRSEIPALPTEHVSWLFRGVHSCSRMVIIIPPSP